MKIYLSRDTIEALAQAARNELEAGGFDTQAEIKALEDIHQELAWANERRDEKGRVTLSAAAFDWVMAELDWAFGELRRRESEEDQ